MSAQNTTEGPLGIPMKDDQARDVEAILKDLPAECREMGLQRMTVVGKKVDVDKAARTDVSLVTTNAVDRDFEVVEAGGADWKQFRRNPVVTFAHDYRALPVGRALWLRRSKENDADGWLAKTEYASRPEGWEGPWLPDAVLHMVAEGFLPGKSIGFIPTDMRAPNEKEIEARPELAKVQRIITKWLALEYAVAPVQSNPDALVQHVAKMAQRPPDALLEALGIIIPEAPQPAVRSVQPVAIVAQLPPIDADAAAAQMAAYTAALLAQVPAMVEKELDKLRGRV